MRTIHNYIFALLLAISLCSCKKEYDSSTYYLDSVKLIEKKKYSLAIAKLDKIFEKFDNIQLVPYSEVLKAYAAFKANKHRKVVAIITSYLEHYENHPTSDYAKTLLLLSKYKQMVFRGSKRGGSASNIEEEKRILATIDKNSKYYEKASKTVDEMELFYYKKKLLSAIRDLEDNNPVSAIVVLNRLLEQLPKSEPFAHPIVVEVKSRLAEAYYMIDEIDQAIKYLPNSKCSQEIGFSCEK